MHKDQVRVKDLVLPLIAQRIYGRTPEEVRDCIVLNRLLSQGPDPLYLMEADPEGFKTLCHGLGLSVDDGRDAVESAHWRGPGALLEGRGLPSDAQDDALCELPVAWRREMLWLLLAGCSDGSEAGYLDETPVLERIRRATAASLKASRLFDGTGSREFLLAEALQMLRRFEATTPVELDDRGFPHSDAEHAFYVLYKQGHKVVAAHSPDGSVFWGTVPGTSLDEQGVTVDKKVSETFGMVFPPKPEQP